ncbi:unnamed protein product [Pelagomonas calceolata]|uniref:Uncharacterized protein n=1 Tax=Pelagomonas calceolata TaxID=35677 RepID=A0A7S4E203_9STRA|nr:unnamed protein product [Pelagomonas calceolata]
MSSRFLVRQGSERLGRNAEEPSPVAVAQCTLIMELVMGAVWFGLWAGYDMAENCDKDLRLWYALMLGGIVFGLICQVGVVIAARKESKPALKLCKVLIKLDQFFEFGVHLWGVDLAYGKKSDRVGAGGCKVLATWQKVNATAILCFGALVMGAILFGAGEDAEKAEENFVAAEMRSPAMRKHTEMKRMQERV